MRRREGDGFVCVACGAVTWSAQACAEVDALEGDTFVDACTPCGESTPHVVVCCPEGMLLRVVR